MENKLKSNQEISAIDLFCGVGGLTHGLIKGGVSVAAGIDIDPACRYPFETNNDAKFLEQDISLLNANDIEKLFKRGAIRLLAGCAPCQPYSTYSRGRRNRHHDSQWSLLLSFSRLIREIRPELVTMENVPQLLGHEVFKQFIESLSDYKVWWSIIDCSLLGVPQTRKRLVLLASSLGDKKLTIEQQQKKVVTVRETIGHLPPILAGDKHIGDSLHASPRLSILNMKRIKASKPGGTWRDWPASLRTNCHTKLSGSTYPSVYGRMEWDKSSPTITTQCFGYGNGRFGHPEQDRAISLREAAMLQTFPENYVFTPPGEVIKFNKIGKLIGNAVPVKLGEVIARTFLEHIHQVKEKETKNSIN